LIDQESARNHVIQRSQEFDPFTGQTRSVTHRLPPPVAWSIAYETMRDMVWNWPLWRATVGPEIRARVRAEYAAHDSWENEGGAHLAYAD
jgi:hypothetical protein